MSVHDRTALFEDLSRASTVPPQKPRSLSAASVPVIRISSEAENPPELPIWPSLALRPQRTAPPAPRPKPIRLKSRPTVPPRLPTDDGVLSSRSVADGPPRIQLVDYEIELSHGGLSSPSRLEDQALFVEDGGSRATSPSNSSRQKAIDKAVGRTKLVAGSALDKGRRKSMEAVTVVDRTASVVGKNVSENAVKLKDGTLQVIVKSGAPKAFRPSDRHYPRWRAKSQSRGRQLA